MTEEHMALAFSGNRLYRAAKEEQDALEKWSNTDDPDDRTTFMLKAAMLNLALDDFRLRTEDALKAGVFSEA